jgi:signal transduction histidine kinase
VSDPGLSIRDELLEISARLTRPEGRAEAIAQLARVLECEEAIIFIRDPDARELIPAPGFPQTLPEARMWRQALKQSPPPGSWRARVCSPVRKQQLDATILRPDEACALAALGGSTDPALLAQAGPVLRITAAALLNEHVACIKEAELAAARKATSDAAELARALDQARGELRNTVDALVDRTTELTQFNSDLQRFSYVISHDLQEPLRMIANFGQLLRRKYDGKLDAEAHEYLGYMIDGAKRMKALIEDILTYARVGDPEKRPFDRVEMADALKTALINLQFSISETSAAVTSSELPAVRGIEIQMVQLFQNLIGNAIKYRSEETPRIHISASRAGGEWMFCVEDNGIGVEPAYLEHVFGMFKRLHASNIPGTGIGLAICRRIVERHGGKIWLEPARPRGTRVCFTMPAID